LQGLDGEEEEDNDIPMGSDEEEKQ